jgi:hypothetical protein
MFFRLNIAGIAQAKPEATQFILATGIYEEKYPRITIM